MKSLNEGLVMTQEDKELLLRDLCARVPYGVKVQYMNNIFVIDYVSSYEEVKLDVPDNYTVGISEVKPYLFPLSSMTEKQKKEYQYITERRMYDPSYSISDSTDWLNKNHFDYRGLIKKDLAIDATGLNIY